MTGKMLVVSFQWGITMIWSKNDMHIRKATPAYGKDDEILISMGNGYGEEDTNILSFGGFHEEHEIVSIDSSVLLKLLN